MPYAPTCDVCGSKHLARGYYECGRQILDLELGVAPRPCPRTSAVLQGYQNALVVLKVLLTGLEEDPAVPQLIKEVMQRGLAVIKGAGV